MIGALVVVCLLLGWIAAELRVTNKILNDIDERIADVTVDREYSHHARIRTMEDS